MVTIPRSPGPRLTLKTPTGGAGGGRSSGGAVGEVLGDVGASLLNFATNRLAAIEKRDAALQKLQDATNLTAFDNGATRGAAEIAATMKVEDDPSSPGFTDRVHSKVTTMLDALEKTATTGVGGKKLLSESAAVELKETRESILTSVFKNGLKTEFAAMGKSAVDSVAVARQDSAANVLARPENFERALATLPMTLERFADVLTPEQEREAMSLGTRSLVIAKINGEITAGGFAAARSILVDERFEGAFPLKERLALIDDIDSAEDARFEHFADIDANAEKMRKREREERAVELTLGIADGATGEGAVIEALRLRQIDRRQFGQLMTALSRAEPDDVNAVAALGLRADVLDGRAGVTEILASHAVGEIDLDTAEELIGAADQVTRRGGVLARADVRAARGFVDSTIGGIRGPLAILDSASSERTQNALRDFDNQVRKAGESGQSFDPFAIADEVVEGFRTKPPSPTAFRRPRYLVGMRASPDIDKSMLRTLDALDRGLITQQEAMEEIMNLEAIEDALEQRSAKQ